MTRRFLPLLFAASAFFAPAVASAACPATTVRASAGSAPFSDSPARPTTFLLAARHVRTQSTDGVSIDSAPPGTCIEGANVTGTQSRSLPWSTVEHGFPFDGVHWTHARPGAPVSVINAHVTNFVDAIGPPKGFTTAPRGSSFVVSGLVADFIRDDVVENDACMQGLIENSRVISGHTFLSERNSSGPCRVRGTVTVRNVNVHLTCMPQTNKHSAGCPAGQATGSIFKWNAGSGCVNMSNSTFTLEGVPASGVDLMAFPCGHYSNVTIFWRGPGPYPAKVPPGVTVR